MSLTKHEFFLLTTTIGTAKYRQIVIRFYYNLFCVELFSVVKLQSDTINILHFKFYIAFFGGVFVAHLIKLEDCVSRYQYDMYRYPGQFSRLKRERWDSLKREWENSYLNDSPSVNQFVEEQKKSAKGAFDKIKKWYKRENRDPIIEEIEEKPYRFKYTTLPELKTTFLHELFEFQLNWASSTLRETSIMKKQLFYDPTLKWLLQSFPDNYFVLYYPTVTYPKATVQFDILLIGPTDIWCIVNLNGSGNTIFQSFSERYWLELEGEEEKKIINPLLSLNRMSTIVKRILADSELDMAVRKAVLTKNGYIDVSNQWSGANFFDQRNIDEWNDRLKNNSSPIKSVQLKFSQYLLDACQTISELRYDIGVEEEDINSFDNEEY